MHDIDSVPVSEEFARCWEAAGKHIRSQIQGPFQGWLKVNLAPPFLEHLSFRLGNQNFFFRIEDIDGRLNGPGRPSGLLAIADGCDGHPCIMLMQNRGGAWLPTAPGWGLVNVRTGALVDPIALVSNEKIEITDWELQDFAVQIVRQHLTESGRQLMSWVGDPGVSPSIWFNGDKGPEWVIVRAARFPALPPPLPRNWREIAQRCARLSTTGHFASLAVASAEDAFDPSGQVPATPLWRGHAMLVRFGGLETVPTGSALP